MAAVLTVERAGITPDTQQIVALPHESDATSVTIRVDNYSHILSAYGDAAVDVAIATVDLVAEQLRLGACSVSRRHPGLIEIAFGPETAERAADILEVAIAGLTCHPVRLGNLDFHLALTASALPQADRSSSSLPAAVCTPAGDGEEWAAQYRRDMVVAADAMTALTEGRLELVWQAIRSARQPERLLYHEALARLVDGKGGMLSPGDVIPALERLGLVRAFDRHVMALVLDELEHFPGARLGVNISAQSARLDGWWSSMFERLRAAPGVARRLVVEITETAALEGDAHAFVAELRRLGCRVALDDFGVGHASVRNAMTLAPDIIKVDAFFLRRAGFCDQDNALLDHLIGIAAHCAPIVVVEGVESGVQSNLAEQHQARYLGSGGGCWQQGYHFGQPTSWREWRHEPAEPRVVPLRDLSRASTGFRAWSGLSGVTGA